ncbi:hypothetical protein [Asticcacaulis sp. AC402]|uniref:hypothetical protein n=1 Tax=Asticcacaulis sp. AC402 TaxID=1282361 RepID=UPI0003C3DF31|nr:hypothetical protein [Asticcacaulis sp. AC402]ESQ75798.1 hypothetical protein ABAC402_07475 [Asticcacaulis sp. AC402]
MTQFFTRLIVAAIFVFMTVSSPLHAHVLPSQGRVAAAETIAALETGGMDEACAKAMAEAAAADHSGDKHHEGKSSACCDNGCNCPVSHCANMAASISCGSFSLIEHGERLVPEGSSQDLPSYLSDTLKRPPRA